MENCGTISAMIHPLEQGQVIISPGCHFSYRVIGPCCRLFDRDQLPWPSCRLQWRGKEPSWRRIGKRFVVDLATRGHPTYSVEILGQGRITARSHTRNNAAEFSEPMLVTAYWIKLPEPVKEWWYADKVRRDASLSIHPPVQTTRLVSRSTASGSAVDSNTAG